MLGVNSFAMNVRYTYAIVMENKTVAKEYSFVYLRNHTATGEPDLHARGSYPNPVEDEFQITSLCHAL
jgi:hypothetical protein